MKMFKLIDLFVQSLILAGSFIFLVIWRDYTAMLVVYMLVGSTQTLSMLVHACTQRSEKKSLRWEHHRITLGIFIGTVLLVALSTVVHVMSFFLVVYLRGILVLSPILAVQYIYLCYQEHPFLSTQVKSQLSF